MSLQVAGREGPLSASVLFEYRARRFLSLPSTQLDWLSLDGKYLALWPQVSGPTTFEHDMLLDPSALRRPPPSLHLPIFSQFLLHWSFLNAVANVLHLLFPINLGAIFVPAFALSSPSQRMGSRQVRPRGGSRDRV